MAATPATVPVGVPAAVPAEVPILTQTACRKLIGGELRRERLALGISQRVAAGHLGTQAAKLSRYEQGGTKVNVAEIKMLLEFYRVAPERLAGLVTLARSANQPGRWQRYRNAAPDWFQAYVDLEAGAGQIRVAQAEVIPGLLQTEQYIRAIVSPGRTGSAEEAVRLRLDRTRLLHTGPAPTTTFVLAESCLHREVGGPELMRGQLRHLLELTERPNVRIQVLPYRAGRITPFDFVLLTLNSAVVRAPLELAYVEALHTAAYLEDRAAVQTYLQRWRALSAAALEPVRSRDFLLAAAKRYD